MRTQTPVDESRVATEQRGRLRRVLVASGSLCLIGIAIWLLSGSPGLPWRHQPDSRTTANPGANATGVTVFAFPPDPAGGADGPAPKVGKPAPDFVLMGLDGTPLHLQELRGKTIALNFWATWCVPCREEFPLLVSAYRQEAERGLVIVAVDLAEERGQVERFAGEFSADFPIVIDGDSAVAHRYRLVGLPTTFIIDRDGIVRAQQLGPLTEGSLTKKLAAAGFTRITSR